MNSLVTDVSNPVGVVAIESLYNIMDYPFLVALVATFPLIVIGFFIYKYEKRKLRRKTKAK